MKRFLIHNLKWFITFICIIALIKIAEDVFNNEILYVDIIGYKIISTYLLSDQTTQIAKLITNLGGAVCLILILIILLMVIKSKKIKIAISSNLLIITVLNLLLKNIIQRPRPTEYRIINESGYSFPSGHSMISMAFYGFIIYLIYKYIKNKYLKYCLIIFFSILILAIGISRIYLGVHYTSDVIAGFLISFLYLIIYIKIVNKMLKE